MSDIGVVTVSTFLAQALLAALLAVLLLRFHSSRKHAFLRHWALSWWALCAGQLGAMVAFHYSTSLPASDPTRLLATFIAQLGAFYQAGWLIQGATELASGRSLSRRGTLAIFAALAGLALVTTLAYAFTPEAASSRNFLRVSVRALVVAVAFLIAAGLLIKAYRKSSATGPRLVCIAFFLYGSEQLALSWATAGSAGASLRSGILAFDLLMVAVLGIATHRLAARGRAFQARRGLAADREAGLLRRPDRPAEPQALPRPPQAVDRPARQDRLSRRALLPRSGQLQAHQRHLRSRNRGSAAWRGRREIALQRS